MQAGIYGIFKVSGVFGCRIRVWHSSA